jgi:hypothetical protein
MKQHLAGSHSWMFAVHCAQKDLGLRRRTAGWRERWTKANTLEGMITTPYYAADKYH